MADMSGRLPSSQAPTVSPVKFFPFAAQCAGIDPGIFYDRNNPDCVQFRNEIVGQLGNVQPGTLQALYDGLKEAYHGAPLSKETFYQIARKAVEAKSTNLKKDHDQLVGISARIDEEVKIISAQRLAQQQRSIRQSSVVAVATKPTTAVQNQPPPQSRQDLIAATSPAPKGSGGGVATLRTASAVIPSQPAADTASLSSSNTLGTPTPAITKLTGPTLTVEEIGALRDPKIQSSALTALDDGNGNPHHPENFSPFAINGLQKIATAGKTSEERLALFSAATKVDEVEGSKLSHKRSHTKHTGSITRTRRPSSDPFLSV